MQCHIRLSTPPAQVLNNAGLWVLDFHETRYEQHNHCELHYLCTCSFCGINSTNIATVRISGLGAIIKPINISF